MSYRGTFILQLREHTASASALGISGYINNRLAVVQNLIVILSKMIVEVFRHSLISTILMPRHRISDRQLVCQ